jgi:chaperonin GroEL (HSP60 family)
MKTWSNGCDRSAKVVQTALQDAAPVASLLITTEALVAELPKGEEPALMPVMDY